jgi:hypothetical protein
VYLAHRLAVELHSVRLIERVFPVFIGDMDAATGHHSHYFDSKCHPTLPDISVNAVEEKVRHQMESHALGTPTHPDRTVLSVLTAVTAYQGAFIHGPPDAVFAQAAARIAATLTDTPAPLSPRAAAGSLARAHVDRASLLAANDQLQGVVAQQQREIDRLRAAASAARV